MLEFTQVCVENEKFLHFFMTIAFNDGIIDLDQGWLKIQLCRILTCLKLTDEWWYAMVMEKCRNFSFSTHICVKYNLYRISKYFFYLFIIFWKISKFDHWMVHWANDSSMVHWLNVSVNSGYTNFGPPPPLPLPTPIIFAKIQNWLRMA